MRWKLIQKVPYRWGIPMLEHKTKGYTRLTTMIKREPAMFPLPPPLPPPPPKPVDLEFPVDPSGLYRISIE